MSHHMSRRSFTSDDDEPLYFTPTYKPEDLICEGSDTEANPRAIVEKRRRYEQCAERVLRGQLPIIQSAGLRGPFCKDNKNQWVNPWRHREGDWWKPGSKDMLFRREDVMRRAREHGRKDMSPTEALAWCRRDAKRQAKEMGIDDYTDMESDSATRPNRLVVDETIHGDISMEKKEVQLKGEGSLGGPPLPRVPSSIFLTHANMEDFGDTPITGSSISDKDNDGKQPEIWTGIKRPVDIAWLKGSHISKRARWEDPAVSSPTPLPHATSQKFQQKVTGNMTVAQNRILHTIQPRLGLSLETPRQELASRKSYASLQQSDTTFDAEGSFHTNIGQQGQQQLSFFAFESDIQPTYPYEESPKPYPTVPLDTPAGKEARAPQPSATKPVASPRLPSHPRIGAVLDRNHETPGNISFITDVAPSSVNLEHFRFRKKRRCKTDPTEVTDQPVTAIGERSRAPLSEGSKPALSVQRDAILSTPFILHPIQRADRSSLSPIRRTIFAWSKGSSGRSSRVDESWLTTQEEVGVSPSTMTSDSKRTIEREYSPQYENFDNSWVTTQDDFNHAPASSASMDIRQIYGISNFLPRPNHVEHIDAPAFKGYEHKSSLQSSPLKEPFSARSRLPPSKPSPHSPALPGNPNKSGVPMPYNNLDGSSTQSYNTSPVSLTEDKLSSSQACILPQNLGSSQQLPHRITTTSEADSSENTRDDNSECGLSIHVQIPDDSKGDDTEVVVLEINSALEGEQIQEVTVLQANREPNSDMELRANLEASVIIQNAEDTQGVNQEEELQEEEATRAEPDADDVLVNSVLSSGQPSTSSSSAGTNNLTIHSPTSIQKARSVNQIPESSMSKRLTPLLLSEEDVLSPASTQDLNEYLLEAAAVEEDVAVPSGDTGPVNAINPDLEPTEEAAIRNRSPQSPWAPTEPGLMVAPRIIATTETAERYPDAESPNSGWQKEGRPATPDNDIIRPFRDLMTPSPPPEGLKTPEVEQRPSNTQLLVEAATQNPWVNGSKKKSLKRKRVSFGLLDDEDPVQPQHKSQRQRRSPSPESTYRSGAFGSKVAEFDDDVTDMNSFQNHFAAIHRKSVGDDSPKVNGSVKRPSIEKYKTALSGAANLVASSPAIDAMAEAFIAADRDSSRERECRFTISLSPTRKSKRKSYATFEDEDGDDTVIQPSDSHFSTNVALNETSSNAKLGDHTPKHSFDEVEDLLGGDWSVEGELKKASTEFEPATPRRENSVHSRGSLFAFENIWT
ncbi:hypothetical protein EAF04_007766 [Stromatinia cepivora]|nr:hypothetical protein EAF04_007766 [Stromatinia cepivora]